MTLHLQTITLLYKLRKKTRKLSPQLTLELHETIKGISQNTSLLSQKEVQILTRTSVVRRQCIYILHQRGNFLFQRFLWKSHRVFFQQDPFFPEIFQGNQVNAPNTLWGFSVISLVCSSSSILQCHTLNYSLSLSGNICCKLFLIY